MKLTNLDVLNAKPSQKPQKITDGRGMYLFVTPNGYKSWRFKFRLFGKEKLFIIGSYPDVGLSEARRELNDARDLVKNGIDPNEDRKRKIADAAIAASNTFESVAREWLGKNHARETAYDKQVIRRFEADIFPVIGPMPISDIKPIHVLNALRRLENRGAIESAHRMKQKCGQVFRYAVSCSLAERDVTVDLRDALPPVETEHYAAITDPDELGKLLKVIDGDDCYLVTKLALKLAPHVFLRPGALRKAEWSEFDFDNAQWVVPAKRMKVQRKKKKVKKRDESHIVPLSTQAMEILKDLKKISGGGQYVFPSIRTSKKPISENTLNAALRRMGYSTDDMVAHGFRATARTIIEEVLGVRDVFIEKQLGHTVKDANGRAYNRTKFLKQRKAMMQTWSNYLDDLKKKA